MFASLLLPAVFALVSPVLATDAQTADQAPRSGDFRYDPMAISQVGDDLQHPVCLKMRVFLFRRNDDQAPKFVRETTCTTVRPQIHQAKEPQAHVVPAN